MVIDSSAIVAVLLNEKNAAQIAQAIEAASQGLLSAANLLEAAIVIESRKGEAGGRELDLLLYRAAIEIVAVDQDQAETARIALAAVWQKGPASCRAELWRLLCPWSGKEQGLAVAVSGRRFLANRH
jgi:uncharacterized protein with PIN domain